MVVGGDFNRMTGAAWRRRKSWLLLVGHQLGGSVSLVQKLWRRPACSTFTMTSQYGADALNGGTWLRSSSATASATSTCHNDWM